MTLEVSSFIGIADTLILVSRLKATFALHWLDSGMDCLYLDCMLGILEETCDCFPWRYVCFARRIFELISPYSKIACYI